MKQKIKDKTILDLVEPLIQRVHALLRGNTSTIIGPTFHRRGTGEVVKHDLRQRAAGGVHENVQVCTHTTAQQVVGIQIPCGVG